MKPSFNTEMHVDAQLCQFRLKPGFSNSLLSSEEKDSLIERIVSDEGTILAVDFMAVASVGELFDLLNVKGEVRLATSAINILMTSRMSENLWVTGTSGRSGFKLAEEVEGGRTNDHVVIVGKTGSVSAHADDSGEFVFNVNVKTYMRFEKPLTLDTVMASFPAKTGWEQMISWRKLGRLAELPVYDLKGKGRANYLLSHFRKAKLDDKAKPQSKTNNEQIGDMLVRLNRLEASILDAAREKARHNPETEAFKIRLACCKPYQSNNTYSFRLSDIAVVPSTVLMGFVNEAGADLISPILRDAAEATAHAKAFIDDNLADRELNFQLAEEALYEFMEKAPPKSVRIRSFDKVKIEKRKTANETSTARKMKGPDDATFVIVYLCDQHMDEKRRNESLGKFLKNYTGQGGVYAKSGINFEVMTAETEDAKNNPRKIVDDLIQTFGNQRLHVIVAWQRWKGKMPPKSHLEFELMRRDIACQHVIDERTGGQKDAVKQPAIRAAVYAKFLGCDPVGGKFFEDIIYPFDAALALDVSRFKRKEVVSPTIAYSGQGMISCMPETVDMQTKERRSAEEVSTSINDLARKLPRYQTEGRCSILLIRDGFANENWSEVIRLLDPGISLNVASIKKNLLSIFSDSFTDGYYAVDYVTSDKTGIFGVNAALKTGATLKMVHAVEQVVSQTPITMTDLLDILIGLARKNVTLESGICSLPVPQHLADRTAGELRSFMEDTSLKGYLNRCYSDEINAVGSMENFIYGTIRRFLIAHPSGWAWAI